MLSHANRGKPAPKAKEDKMELLSQTDQTATSERQGFYEKIGGANVTPLWEVLHGIITAKPNTPCLPHLWKWQQMWP